MTARQASRRGTARSGGANGRRRPARFFEGEAITFEGILVAALLAAPLLLGSVPLWAVAVLLGLSLVLALGLVVVPAIRDRSIPWFGLTLCILALFVGLQFLPLPRALVQLLSPTAAEIYRESLVPDAMRRFHPLSLDAPATAVELAKALVCAVVFAAAFAVGRREKPRRRLCMALVGTGVLVALIGYSHRLANLDRLFGFYHFRDVRPFFLTTLANKNNQAGLYCLCAPPALALALTAGERKRAVLWGVCYVLLGAAVFMSLSRGGMVALLLGQVILVLLLPRSGASLGIRAALTGGVLLIAAYLALGEVSMRLRSLAPHLVMRELKIQEMVHSTRMLVDYPLFGVGRGAFPTAGAHYLDVPLGTAEYVENETLQPLLDLGWPMGVVLLLSALFLWVRSVKRPPGTERSAMTSGLAAGLASLFAQNQVDFSLEILGVAVPAMVAFGLLAAESRDVEGRPSSAPGWPRTAFVGALALLLAIPASVGLWYGRHDWRFEVNAFAERAAELPDIPSLLHEAEPLLLRHPASFVLPLTLADRALREHPPQRGAALALTYVNRALSLKPSSPEGHLVAAEALALLGHKDQSLLEARLYFEASGGDDRALRRAVARTPELEALLEAVPANPEGFAALGKILVERSRWDDALAVADAWTSIEPSSAQAHADRGRALRALRRTQEAEHEFRQAVELDASRSEQVRDLASLLAEGGDAEAARKVLERGLLAQPGQIELCVDLARLEIAAGRPEAAALVLRQARVLGAVQRAKVLELSGDVEEALGHGNRAFVQYDQAAALAPGSSAPWKAVSQLERLSRFEEAQVYLNRLKTGAGPELTAQLDARIALDAKKAVEFKLSREAALREAAHEGRDLGRKSAAP